MIKNEVGIICIGDPHVRTDNIPEIDMLISGLIDLVNKKNPDIIVVLGDVLHTHERLHTMALNKAYELINRLRKLKPTRVLVGNHDMCNNQQFLTKNHWMNGMKEWENVVIVDTVFMEVIKDKKFVYVPYVPPGRFTEALNSIGENSWKDASCIFSHQEYFGCKMGAIISEDGDKWSAKNPKVVSGHIHSRQILEPFNDHIHSKQILEPNIYYPGSAMQNAFGESEKNIIPYLKFTTYNKYELEEFDLSLPRKKIVYMDIEDVDDYAAPKDSKDTIKVTVSGNYEQFKALKKTTRYKELLDQGLKVVFKPNVIKDEEENLIEKNSVNFVDIISKLVTSKNDLFLYQAYEAVVNNKEINEDDVIFI